MNSTLKLYFLALISVVYIAHAEVSSSLNVTNENISQFFPMGDINSTEGGTLVEMKIPIPQDAQGNLLVPPSPMAPEGENVRLITVYLPEGYHESTERYPVIYYLPGLGGTNESFAVGNKFLLDNLIRTKQIVPLILVQNDPSLIEGETPQGTRNYRGSWYVNSALNGQFEDFMTQTTIEFVDTTLRTKPDLGQRGIMGQSMGAYGAIYLGQKHPDKYIGYGSASATPFWTLATTGLGPVPSDQLFSINALIQFEIPTEGPNAGKISPDNGELTFSYFSYSAAFSPDIEAINGNPRNPFQGEFFVNLPFEVNGDGTPVFEGGPVTVSSPVFPGNPITYEQSLVLVPEVVEQWKQFDPFTISDDPDVIETMKQQAIYIDGGNIEIANARGARLLSEKWANDQINHEFILFEGGHVDCLVTPLCSRHQTMFQMLSAVFSENGKSPNTIRTRIVGEGTIIVEENASIEINRGTMVGIETLPDKEITETNITLQLNDNGKVTIGTDTQAGGSLQIGNLFSKAKVFGDPSLNDNTIEATIIIDGPNALLQVGEQGFLGLGTGIIGQFPMTPNDWGMSSLFNATRISLDIREGVFDHNQIASGEEPSAAVLALGPCESFNLKVNPETGIMRGGGNLASIPDGWRLQPININDPGILFPNGVRNVLDTLTTTSDYFYKAEMASTGQYQNESFRNLLSSSEQLDNRGTETPFEITDASIDEFTEFLSARLYQMQASKEGAIAKVDETVRVGYLDTISTESKFIRTEDIPLNINQPIDIDEALELGAAGIWVEPVGNQRQLIDVFDIDPGCRR